jgi:hypothetical protein
MESTATRRPVAPRRLIPTARQRDHNTPQLVLGGLINEYEAAA